MKRHNVTPPVSLRLSLEGPRELDWGAPGGIPWCGERPRIGACRAEEPKRFMGGKAIKGEWSIRERGRRIHIGASQNLWKNP